MSMTLTIFAFPTRHAAEAFKLSCGLYVVPTGPTACEAPSYPDLIDAFYSVVVELPDSGGAREGVLRAAQNCGARETAQPKPNPRAVYTPRGPAPTYTPTRWVGPTEDLGAGDLVGPERVPTERAFQLLHAIYLMASDTMPSSQRDDMRALLHDEGNLTPAGLLSILEYLSPRGKLVQLRGDGDPPRDAQLSAVLGDAT